MSALSHVAKLLIVVALAACSASSATGQPGPTTADPAARAPASAVATATPRPSAIARPSATARATQAAVAVPSGWKRIVVPTGECDTIVPVDWSASSDASQNKVEARPSAGSLAAALGYQSLPFPSWDETKAQLKTDSSTIVTDESASLIRGTWAPGSDGNGYWVVRLSRDGLHLCEILAAAHTDGALATSRTTLQRIADSMATR